MFKKYGKYAVLALMAAGVAVSGISAYFTATDTATNNFDVKEVKVDLIEDQWVPDLDTNGDGVMDAVKDITPNETIVKDPSVKNVGTTSQFVFLKVTVPFKNVITAELDGTRNAAADTELFTWNIGADKGTLNAAKGSASGKVDAAWALVDTYVDETNGVVEYTYAYASEVEDDEGNKALAMTGLAVDEETPALFDSITMCNVIEGYEDIENKIASVDVDVYAIQESDLNESGNGTTDPVEVLKIYTNQNSLRGPQV